MKTYAKLAFCHQCYTSLVFVFIAALANPMACWIYFISFRYPRSRFTSSIQNPPSCSAEALKEWWGLGRFKWA